LKPFCERKTIFTVHKRVFRRHLWYDKQVSVGVSVGVSVSLSLSLSVGVSVGFSVGFSVGVSVAGAITLWTLARRALHLLVPAPSWVSHDVDVRGIGCQTCSGVCGGGWGGGGGRARESENERGREKAEMQEMQRQTQRQTRKMGRCVCVWCMVAAKASAF
jgi:hypothetical protein